MKSTFRNYTLLGALFILTILTAYAQDDKSKRPSPPDQISKTVGSLIITIDYSQPSLKGRDLNKLAPLGEVWRTGANEASWIEFSEDVMIEGKSLKKGKYGLFTINNNEEWTIIFNKTWKQWGAYNYNPEEDVLRIKVTPVSVDDITEKFTIDIDDSGLVNLLWGRKIIPFQITKV